MYVDWFYGGLDLKRRGLAYITLSTASCSSTMWFQTTFGLVRRWRKGRLNGFCGVFIGVWSTLFIFYPRCVFQHFALPPSTDEACLKMGIRILMMGVGGLFIDNFYKNLNKSYGWLYLGCNCLNGARFILHGADFCLTCHLREKGCGHRMIWDHETALKVVWNPVL